MKRLLLLGLPVALLAATAAGCVVDDTYATCVDTADCGDPRDECIEVDIDTYATYGAFCSSGCTSDGACESNFGFPGRCYAFSGTDSICFQACDFDTDCWTLNACVEVDLGGGVIDFICVPDNF